MIITNAGMFKPKTNQSSKNVLNFSFLPIKIPKTVPIIIAIVKDKKTLFKVISVWKKSSSLYISDIIFSKTLFGLGNKLELNVETDEDGWLSYIDNWDKGWSVFINGKKMTINKLFGSYKSINIEKGFSKIKFEYKPW